MTSKIQLSRLPGTLLMSAITFVMILGFAMVQGGCRSVQESPEEVQPKRPGSRELIDSLIESGADLRRLDVIDLKGTAGFRSSERTRIQSRISSVASGHAMKYRNHLLELARFSPRHTKDELDARLISEDKIRDLPDLVKVIDLHLRLVRANTPPSESRIIWDFSNLHYLNPSSR